MKQLGTVAMALGAGFVLALGGCTWVPLTAGGEAVRVALPSAAESCERIGRTRTRTQAKIGPFPRSQSRVRTELESLARNEAADMGGNVIAPLDGPREGVQDYGIYRCP